MSLLTWVLSLIVRLFYQEPVVVQRATGAPVEELVPLDIKAQLALLYNTPLGSFLSRLPTLRRYQLQHSLDLGRLFDARNSQPAIAQFIADYGVQLGETEKPVTEYATLNEFFARRLKPGARPIYLSDDPGSVVQPADARLVVFPSVLQAQRLWVKGKAFSLAELLGQPPPGGQQAIAIARLAPDDYHRFHSPVAGVVRSVRLLGRELFSVKAIAVRSHVNVLCENKRAVLALEAAEAGLVWLVAVGACQVGSIQLGVTAGEAVAKGQELGCFQYGGSSVVLVFDTQRVRLDSDLVENSALGRETLVRMGTSLGRAAA